MSRFARTRPRSAPAPGPAHSPRSVTCSWGSSARPATTTSPPPSAKPNTTTTCSSPSSASPQSREQQKGLCPQPCTTGSDEVIEPDPFLVNQHTLLNEVGDPKSGLCAERVIAADEEPIMREGTTPITQGNIRYPPPGIRWATM